MNINLLTLPASASPLILDDATRAYLENSKAPNTKLAYARAWKDFSDYCKHTAHAQLLPAAPQTVAAYLAYLGKLPIKVSTIEQRLAGIAFFHRTANREDPTTHSVVHGVMSGIRRERAQRGETPKQAEPIMREDLYALVEALPDNLTGLRDRALILLQWALALRQSTVAQFEFRDIEFLGKRMRVTIRKSKTDQSGEGTLKEIKMLDDAHARVCPVRAVRTWIEAAEIVDGALFRKVNRWGYVETHAMNPRSVAFIIDRSVARIGLDPKLYSGHSSRAGFTTQADADGVPLHEIQDVTDHRSGDMVRRYLRRRGVRQTKTIQTTLQGPNHE